VSRDHDLLLRGEPQKPGKIILDFRQGHLSRMRPRPASLVRRATLGPRLS
jgi:hypothetical protein